MRYFFNPLYPTATVLADGEPALRVLQIAPRKIAQIEMEREYVQCD
jgi:hypothetical protein